MMRPSVLLFFQRKDVVAALLFIFVFLISTELIQMYYFYTDDLKLYSYNIQFFSLKNLYHISDSWQLFTYSFVHVTVEHFVSNLLVLALIFYLFIKEYNGYLFVFLFVFGSFISGLLLSVIYNSLGLPLQIAGSSAGIYSLFLAVTIKLFNYKVFGKLELKYIALFLILRDLFLYFGNEQSYGSTAIHLIGGLVGIFFVILHNLLCLPRINVRDKGLNDKLDSKEVAEILKQVQQSGYDSLTNRQKIILQSHNTYLKNEIGK